MAEWTLTVDNVGAFLRERHADVLATRLGGEVTQVVHRSDGNINQVLEVVGSSPAQRVCVKQALPHMRILPEFALARQRIDFEHASLEAFGRAAPESVPRVWAFDQEAAVLIMEFIFPHKVLRHALAESDFVGLGVDCGAKLARVLFATSVFGMDPGSRRELLHKFAGNDQMCMLTEQAIFTTPLIPTGEETMFPNRWTSPDLDSVVERLQGNAELRNTVVKLKHAFMTRTEALIHGDLHSGSILVAPSSEVRFFDNEFAMMGPIGFDVGVLVANLVMAACARPERQAVLVRNVADFWTTFRASFVTQCDTTKEVCASFLDDQVWPDALGFAACEIVRRIVGIAHVEDFESIEDPRVRAVREARALELAQRLLLARTTPSLGDLIELISSDSPKTASVVLVAKFPRVGRSKTRLASEIGQEPTLDFSRACVADLVDKFGTDELDRASGLTIHRTILFSPAEDHDEYRAWLDSTCPEFGPKWKLEVIADKSEDPNLGRLGAALADVLARNTSDVVSFIGMDTPQLSMDEMVASLTVAASKATAHISPASDGGYVLLALPGWCESRVFADVAWSTPAAFATQVRAIQQTGCPLQVGTKVWTDIDEVDAYEALRSDLLGADRETLPRLTKHFASAQHKPRR